MAKIPQGIYKSSDGGIWLGDAYGGRSITDPAVFLNKLNDYYGTNWTINDLSVIPQKDNPYQASTSFANKSTSALEKEGLLESIMPTQPKEYTGSKIGIIDVKNTNFLKEYEGQNLQYNGKYYQVKGGKVYEIPTGGATANFIKSNKDNIYDITELGVNPVGKISGSTTKDAMRYADQTTPEYKEQLANNFGLGRTYTAEETANNAAVKAKMDAQPAQQLNVNPSANVAGSSVNIAATDPNANPYAESMAKQGYQMVNGQVVPISSSANQTTSTNQSQLSRDLEKEKKAVDQYIKETGDIPNTTAEWAKVAAIAYGPGYTVVNGVLVPPPSQIPNQSKEEELNNQKKTEQQQSTTSKILDPELNQLDFTNQGGLVRFSSDPDGTGPYNIQTVFYVDPTSKKLIPFMNEEAFNNYMISVGMTNINIGNAEKSGYISVISPNSLSAGFALDGYAFAKTEEGVQSDGTYTPIETTTTTTEEPVDTSSISQTYGQAKNSEAVNLGIKILDGILSDNTTLSANGISQEIINSLSKDAKLFYINALTYGGYDVPQIIQDLKRKQLVANGETQYANTKIIDATQTATNYYNTDAGKIVLNDANLDVTGSYGNLSLDTLSGLSIYNLPQEAYDVLVPAFDYTSAEGKALLDSIETSYYDVLMKQLDATTEQEKALADYNWQVFKDDLDKNYNIKLSNNSLTAWNELQSLRGTNTERGISDSGIFSEMQDKYLQSVRKNDQLLRDEKTSTANKQNIDYLMKSGTPEQIQAFLNSITDPAEKASLEKYFKPDQELVNYFSLANLKTLFPDADESALKRYSESLIDSNTGLFRSQLYQKLYENKYGPLTAPAEGVQVAKEAYQLGEAKYDDDGNLIGGYGALYKQALEQQAKEREYSGDPYNNTYKANQSNQSGQSGTVSDKLDGVSYVPDTNTPVETNPYAASQAAYTAATGKTVPGYNSPTIANPVPDTTQPVTPDIAPANTSITPPNTANPFYGIPATESSKMTTVEQAKQYWKNKGYTGY
jgi:hypothetical protein